METILKKPYEISLWKDILTFRDINGKESEGSISEDLTTIAHQYYKERKICVIGSNTMDSPIRAVQPKLASNVNGSHTLTFTMYSHYWNEETNKLEWNPFMRYLTNERKVKLKYNGKWYDFIIKNISEDSASKAFTYTCKDLFINELSKSGFDLEFDNELENNMGTLDVLAERVLEGSDWQYKGGQVAVRQYLEEPLYEITLNTEIEATRLYNDSSEENNIKIPANSLIYVFYSSVAQEAPMSIQFLYDATQKYELDDSNVIIGHTEDTPNGVYNFTSASVDIIDSAVFCPTIRGKKIVKSQKTTYDAKIDRLVGIYNDGAVYGFKDVEYISPAYVRSYVTSGDCANIAGWTYFRNNKNEEYPDRQVISYPEISSENIDNYYGDNYIKFTCGSNANIQYLVNTGITDNKRFIGSFSNGEVYFLRGSVYTSPPQPNSDGEILDKGFVPNLDISATGTAIQIIEYTLSDFGTMEVKERNVFTLEKSQDGPIDNYGFLFKCTCNRSYSEEDFKTRKFGIVFSTEQEIYVRDLQFFKAERMDDIYITPDATELASKVQEKYIYYNPKSSYTSLEDLVPLLVSEEPSSDYEPYYGSGAEPYEKVRSITVKESNRFNILQSLSELFECWCRFTIEHENNGTISLDENFRQKKFVSFHEYIGKKNYAGFRYGTNLKSIKRTLDSNGTISKIIVKPNSNEFAPNGFCTIQRAEENQTGENFIYNFDYYIGQGLINFSLLNNDLYLEVNGYLGYYTKLKKLNTEAQLYTEKYQNIGNEIANYESYYQVYKAQYDAAIQDEKDKEEELRALTGYTSGTIFIKENGEVGKNKENWLKNNETKKILAAIAKNRTIQKESEKIYTRQESLKIAAETEQKSLEGQLKAIKEEKLALNIQFYKKYSRFIQEGSWISEDYIDDNLYYIDALSTLYTSSRPQVSYTIEVIELSQLPGFENYNFDVGDKTFIQDEEFFGWSYDGSKRLYREEVIVSETIIELDSPEKNSIKVQNYKTQFEDLFQRVVATTQQVQFSTGEYQRSAAIMQPDGTISASVLQNSMINNALTLENSRDQSVRIDENGITTTNLSRPSEMLRAVAGGIFLSRDGGANWTTGITASGINANAITTGQLNAGEVNITMGSEIAFRWDLLGISAYKRDDYGIDSGTFTRFDQFGIYGIDNISNFDALSEDRNREQALQYIKDTASFGLTWDGFWLKAKGTNGYTSISSDRDFEVVRFNDNKEKISIVQIGRLGMDESYYGIRINDLTGAPVMESDSSGQLWLRKQLQVQTDKGTSVVIGLGGESTSYDGHGEEIINANDQFKVYEDGYLVGENVQLKGTIFAEGGSIGGLTIEQWKDMGFSVRVESSAGSILKIEDTTLTATLYQGTEEYSLKDGESLTYQWYRNEVTLAGKTAQSLLVELKDLDKNETAVYTCTITLEIKGGAS